MILVDSNVPMYLVGDKHPHKADAQRLLDDLIAREERLVTDVEVLQEILYRYTAVGVRKGSSLRSTRSWTWWTRSYP